VFSARTRNIVLLSILALTAAAGCGKHEDPVGAAKLDLKHRKYKQAVERLIAAPPEVRGTYDAQLLLGQAYSGANEFEKSATAFKRAAGLDKTRAEPYLGLAEAERRRAGKTAVRADAARYEVRALDYCRAAIEIDDKSAKAYTIMAAIYEGREDNERAIEAYKKAIEREPDVADHRLAVGKAFLRSEMADEAVQAFDQALEQDPSLAMARFLKANIIMFRNKPGALEEAKKEYALAAAEQKAPAGVRGQALAQLARIALSEKKVGEARKHVDALGKYPELRGYRIWLEGMLYVAEENWPKAYESLKQLDSEDNKNIQFLMQIAQVERQLKMNVQATGHYQKVVELRPHYAGAHVSLAQVLFVRGLLGEADKHVSAALREEPGNVLALRLLARIRRSRRDFTSAEVYYRRILAYTRDDPDVNLDLAELLIEMVKPDRAIYYAKAAGDRGNPARTNLTLGQAYLLKRSMVPEGDARKEYTRLALEHLTKAQEQAPTSALVVVSLARAYAAIGSADKAVGLLGPFTSRNPRQGMAYDLLAAVHEQKGEIKKAVTVLERAAAVPGIIGFDPGRLGRAYFLAGQYKKAITIWEPMAHESTARKMPLQYQVGLAAAFASEGRYAKALPRARVISEVATQRAGGGALLAAVIAVQAGEFEQATELLDKRSYPSPKVKTSYQAFVDLLKKAGADGKKTARLISEATVHAEFGSYDGALRRFRQAKKLIPDSPIPSYLIVSTLTRARRFRDVGGVLKEVIKAFPAEGFPHYQAGMLAPLLLKLPEPFKRRDELEFALDLDPGLAVAHVALADAMLKDHARTPNPRLLEQAAAHAAEAVELDGGTRASLEVAARAYYALTRYRRAELFREEDPNGIPAKRALAVESARKTRAALGAQLQKFPDSVAAVRTSVQFEISERHFRRAESLASQFIASYKSDDRDLLLLLAVAVTNGATEEPNEDVRLEKLRRAALILEDLIRRNPRDHAAYRQLANVYEVRKRADLILRTLERMRRTDPANPQLALQLALAYQTYNAPERAKALYETLLAGLANVPDNPVVRAVRAQAIMGVAKSLMLLPAQTPEDRTKNITKALDALGPLTRPADPKPHLGALLLKGELTERLGKPNEALAIYERCAELAPNSDAPRHAIALLHFKQGEHAKTVDIIINKIMPRRAHQPFAHSRLALAYLLRNTPGDIGRAAQAAKRAEALLARRADPGRALPKQVASFYYDTNIVVALANRKPATARTEIKKIPDLDEMTRDTFARLIETCAGNTLKREQFVRLYTAHLLFLSSRASNDATAALERVVTRFPGNLYLLTRLTGLYKASNQMGKFVGGTELQIRAAEAPGSVIQPARLQALYVDLIDAYMIRLSQRSGVALTRAERLCKRGVAKWPRHVGLLTRMGTIHARKGELKEAASLLTRAAALSKRGSEPWLDSQKTLAQVCHAMNDWPKLLSICKLLEPLTQTDPMWTNNCAWYHATAPQPNYPKAIELATQAKTLDPTSPAIRDTLGWILYLAGRHRLAETELAYAAQRLPRDASVAYHLGANYMKQGKAKEALPELERALDLGRRGQGLEEEEHCKKLIEDARAQLKTGS